MNLSTSIIVASRGIGPARRPASLRITDEITIAETEIEERFVRASGPGGQNVNKVSTAVELRVDIARSCLPGHVKQRLATLAGNRMTGNGVLVIDSREHRTQSAQSSRCARAAARVARTGLGAAEEPTQNKTDEWVKRAANY